MPRKTKEAQQERQLYDLKWHDYRMLSPDMCTLVFICEYSRAVRWQRVEEYGIPPEEVKNLSVLDGNPKSREKNPNAKFDFTDIKAWRYWNIMEKLRRWADEMYLPYDKFWEWAFAVRRKLNYKYSTPTVFAAAPLQEEILNMRDEYERHYIFTSKLPVFRAEAYSGTPLQDDYCECVVGDLRRKYESDRVFTARLKTLIKDGVLSREFVEKLKRGKP